MLEYKINTINHKFEDIKEEVNSGKILLYAEWEIEDLLLEANELIPLIASFPISFQLSKFKLSWNVAISSGSVISITSNFQGSNFVSS